MQRALLSTAAAVILAAASITPASAQHKGGGGGGVSRGGSPGVAHSAPSVSGGGSAFRSGGGGMQFRGSSGTQFRGGGNIGTMNAVRGPVGGNQFRAASPTSRSFAPTRSFTQGNFAQGHFAQVRPFRHGRSIVRFGGAPLFYDDYGYYPYSSYSSDDECYETRQIWTNAGWRYAQVYVCDQ